MSDIEPTPKADAINQMIFKVFGKDRPATIQAGNCMTCDATGLKPSSFKDKLSLREYTISGLCQACQDKVFG